MEELVVNNTGNNNKNYTQQNAKVHRDESKRMRMKGTLIE